MKNNKLKLILYEFAVKFRLIFYLMAVLIVFVPIFIVLVTDNAFNSFYSKIFVSTAITFVIIGRILTSYKKTIENGTIHWASIGSIIGLLIVLVWDVLK